MEEMQLIELKMLVEVRFTGPMGWLLNGVGRIGLAKLDIRMKEQSQTSFTDSVEMVGGIPVSRN